MQFTRLRLVGFKSFVDPTELVIEHGLTGVVGPNGCGKSNLLEALRWVMGESRPTAMRGDGMDDVIFAGSSARSARAHAEVVLRIDNTARRAPATFNQSDELEITRRITRAAGSAYRVNGKEARARDVQLLFADAASGATSPSLVRQGQISELINAKPKARRRVLEEAAGISGLYARRHEAELKLRATEANLERIGDVVDALDTQIASLARQARQAARYRDIAEALRRAEAMHLLKVWHEAEADRAAAAAALTAALTDLARAEAEASRGARARDDAGEALPGLREEAAIAGAVLQRTRLEGEKLEEERTRAERRIADLTAGLDQVAHDEAREVALDADAGETLEVLERERLALEAEGSGEAERVAAARAAAEAAREALDRRETEVDHAGTEAAALGARHEAARRVLGEARSRLAGAERQAEEAARAHAKLDRELAEADAARKAAAATSAAAAERAALAEAALGAAETAAQGAGEAEAAARSARAAAEGEAQALGREHGTLAALLERDRPRHDPVLEAVTVVAGYERAVGAAFGDDLGFGEGDATGWRVLDPIGAAALPGGAAPLAEVVEAPPALARRLATVGVIAREDGARLQAVLKPGQRLVSRDGDLWRWDGLAVAAGDGQSAAALRLEQRNRLAALAAALAEAKGRAGAAVAEHEGAAETLAAARAAEAAARTERRAADQAAAEGAKALGRAETARDGIAARLAGVEAGLGRHRAEIAASRQAVAEAEAEATGLADLDGVKAALGALRGKLEAARGAMLAARSEADGLARAADARAKRLEAITAESASWTRRRGSAGTRLGDLARRRADTEAALAEANAVPASLEAAREKLGAALSEATGRHGKAAEALAGGEAAAREADAAARAADRAASDAREARARAETRAEAAGEKLGAAAARVEAEAGASPQALAERLAVAWDALPEAAALAVEVERLTRARDNLGAVNLRAEEDAKAAEVERDALVEEKADLEAAIAKLRHGIAQLNREGRGRLLAAFEEVNARFGELFIRLFGGGEASLVLVDSDDPLDAGLEIMAQPPGKKLATLSLLSGGEQTLTALSLIFAVFLANPAPICVLDEVDAPLDDANVTRFCDLLDEMTKLTETRFLIITHHALTMARMDRLFGVTMVEKGVSQLVSVDLAAAERIIEPA